MEVKSFQFNTVHQLQKINNYRPVALMSHIMNIFEVLVLRLLQPLFHYHEDLVQFGTHGCGGWSDLHALQTHCQDHVLWFLPLWLGNKLSAPTVTWIMDYLTNWSQFMRQQNCVKSCGSGQGRQSSCLSSYQTSRTPPFCTTCRRSLMDPPL